MLSYLVAVTGGRDYQNRAAVFRALDKVDGAEKINVVLHGACSVVGNPFELRGADRWADEWVRERSPGRNLIADRHHAYWTCDLYFTIHGAACHGPTLHRGAPHEGAAGPARNRRMLVARPQLLLAFPGGAGTASCVAIARELGIEVREIA